MNEPQKTLLETTLKRIDYYIGTVNTKAAFIIAFNSFILGGLILKSDEILSGINFYSLKIIAIVSLIILVIGLGWSLFWVFKAVNPYLNSGNSNEETIEETKEINNYRSLLFFKSIFEFEKEEYKKRVHDLTIESLQNDFEEQCHVLSKGLSDKFLYIKRSTIGILYFVVLPLFLIVLVKLLNELLGTIC